MKKSWKEQLTALEAKLQLVNIYLSAEQLARLEMYLHLLESWNKRTNLVSSHDAEYLVERHIFESLAVSTVSAIGLNSIVMDLGSGAGFPGIPLKILRPDFEMKLVDSKRMKYLFLKEVIRHLDLNNTEALCIRVESLDAIFVNYFDVVVCRAVATLAELWNWSAAYLKTKGKLLAMKGGDLTEECAEFYRNFAETQLVIHAYPQILGLDTLHKKLVVITKEA